MNLASKAENLTISIEGLDSSVHLSPLTKTLLASSNAMDENSFSQPNKVPKAIVLFVSAAPSSM